MGAEIRVAGFTLTLDEWERLDARTRDELLETTAGDVDGDEEDEVDPMAAEVLW